MKEPQPVDFNVIYAFTFFSKFTDMVASPGLWPSTIEQFELALASNERSPRDWSSVDRLQSPDWKYTIDPAMEFLQYNISSSATRHWPEYFYHMSPEVLKDASNLLSLPHFWNGENKLVDAGGWFGLELADRAMLLRCLIDYALTHSKSIRAMLTEFANKEDDSILVTSIGRDANRYRYYHFDDSPRVYREGNPYKRASKIELVTETEEEIRTLIDTFGTTQSPTRSNAEKEKVTGNLAAERHLKRNLAKVVLSSLEKGRQRMAELETRRITLAKQLIEEREEEERAVVEEEARLEQEKTAKAQAAASPHSVLGKRRAAARKLDYRAIENGLGVTTAQQRSSHERHLGLRSSQRSRSTSTSHDVDLNAWNTTQRTTRRSNLRHGDKDPVLEVAEWEARQQMGSPLPHEQHAEDYDLDATEDYTVFARNKVKVIKGRNTLLSELKEMAAAQHLDTAQSRSKRQLSTLHQRDDSMDVASTRSGEDDG